MYLDITIKQLPQGVILSISAAIVFYWFDLTSWLIVLC